MSAPFVAVVVALEARTVVRWSAPDEAAHRRLVLDLAARTQPGAVVEAGSALAAAIIAELDRLREAS